MKQKQVTQKKPKRTRVSGDKDLMAIEWSEASKAAPMKGRVVKPQMDSAEKAFRHSEDPYKSKKHMKKKRPHARKSRKGKK